jgi:peptide/nickel transport system permease protein
VIANGAVALERTRPKIARRRPWQRLLRHPRAMVGALLLTVITLVAILADVLSPFDPIAANPSAPLRPPFSSHLLGTDDLGRDLLSRLLFGARYTLLVGGLTAVLSVVVGSIAGGVAGYIGGRVDVVISGLIDILLSVPLIPLVILVSSVVELTPLGLVGIISLFQWMPVTRLVRAEFLSLRERDFVTAARTIGVSSFRIIFVHLLPNAVAPIAVVTTLVVANAILIESSLSFLGFGIRPPTPTWGNMLTRAQTDLYAAPWLAIFPGLLITVCLTSMVIVGDALRDAFDPRLSD